MRWPLVKGVYSEVHFGKLMILLLYWKNSKKNHVSDDDSVVLPGSSIDQQQLFIAEHMYYLAIHVQFFLDSFDTSMRDYSYTKEKSMKIYLYFGLAN